VQGQANDERGAVAAHLGARFCTFGRGGSCYGWLGGGVHLRCLTEIGNRGVALGAAVCRWTGVFLADKAGGQLWLRGLLALGYTYGFRRGELLGNAKRGTEPMRCKQVDLLNNTVTLYSGETKNDEGRTVALTEECRQLVTELRKGKQPDDFLFTRDNGEAVRDFRDAWDALTKAAGVPGLLFHDFRRSAVRNMMRRGVPQKTAREISDHKTDAVFSRYNITSVQDIRDAARKIEEGAKAAVSGSIHSSFIVAPDQGSQEDGQNKVKPS